DAVLTEHGQNFLTHDPGRCAPAAVLNIQMMLVEDLRGGLLDELRLALLHYQHRALVAAELHPLLGDERISSIQDVQRDTAVAKRVSTTEQFHCAQRIVVEAALQDDTNVLRIALNELVQPLPRNELYGCRQALLNLLF